jgi:hypothetical protein
LALGAVAAVAAGLACESIFDDPIQCRADADCSRFSGARCDVIQGVCVARGQGEEDGSVLNPPRPSGDAGDLDAPSNPDTFVGDKCAVSPKPQQVVGTVFDASPEGGAAEITTSTTLGCDKEWILKGNVYVRPGATLTIEPGTLVMGDQATNGALYVLPGAQIVANGTAAAPVVFTSSRAAGTRAPGDWRGVFLLGSAPTTAPTAIPGDPSLTYGGANATDSSGTLRYVRIEYSAEGLVAGGLGSGTTIDFVQVRRTTNNCFWFRGGRVSPRHLVCQLPADEGYEFEQGYEGYAQYLVSQRLPLAPGHHGLLVTAAFLHASNVTLCGVANSTSYGLVVRNGAQLDFANGIITKYLAGVDVIGLPGTTFQMRSTLFKNDAQEVAYPETDAETDAASPLFDDDNGFDENGFILDGGQNNRVQAVIPNCDDPNSSAGLAPATAIVNGAVTPGAGFDSAGAFIGAVKDTSSNWLAGWTVFSAQ